MLVSFSGEFKAKKHNDMKAKSKRKVEACKRSVRHVADHPLTTPNARLTALVTLLNTMLTSFRDYTAGQSVVNWGSIVERSFVPRWRSCCAVTCVR